MVPQSSENKHTTVGGVGGAVGVLVVVFLPKPRVSE